MPARDQRIAFYCGVVSFGAPKAIDDLFDYCANGGILPRLLGDLLSALIPIFYVISVAVVLSIPAIQLRSYRRAFYAFLLAWPLQILSGFVLEIHLLSIQIYPVGLGWESLVPGIHRMNPALGYTPYYVRLGISLLLFVAVTNAVLAPRYWKTKLRKFSFGFRLFAATAILMCVFAAMDNYLGADDASRSVWALGTTVWLICGGLYAVLLYGTAPNTTTKFQEK